ncbi:MULTISPECIES: hypothetical protein [Lelliottia]|nr:MULTISPECIES: hypothetical protein [Lelliottia]
MIKMFEHEQDEEEGMTATFALVPDVVHLYRTALHSADNSR